MFRSLLVATLFVAFLSSSISVGQEKAKSNWYRGNLHTHSLWSDGNDFPDMIVKWYVDNGYNFLALTDHNILSNKERWMLLSKIEKRGGKNVLTKYREAFGENWVEIKGDLDKGDLAVRLKKYGEIRKRFDKSGEFMLMTGEEISDSVNGLPLHLNATNVKLLLRPTGGNSIREAMTRNLRAAQQQAEEENRQILVHLNHPNFGWAVTAEDLAAVTLEKFVEVYNGHPGVNHLGDKNHPSVERIWDIANTIRISELESAPLFGLATDDSHNYHGKPGSHTGRGWIMVRATELNSKSILTAVDKGDFYCSSGVTLDDVHYDPKTKKLSLKISGEKGATYKTQFIGTMKDFDKKSKPRTDKDGKPIRSTRVYSDDIGKVLATVEGNSPSFQLTGNELYVRAVVTSDEEHEDPSFKNQKKQAWTQPVGWRK